MFDMTKDIVLDGTVAQLSWGNPHVYIGLEMAGPDGKTVRPPTWRRWACAPIRFALATTSSCTPSRAGAGRTVLGWVLTTADGVEIPLHVRAMQAAAAGSATAASIAETWGPQASGFSALSFAARERPLTDAGRAAIAATRDARAAARSECVPFGPPALMALPATAIIQVSGVAVTFNLDTMDVERVVYLNQAHPADLEPSGLGHSIGHWEGGAGTTAAFG